MSPMFDPTAAPGWADWVGLGLTILGFGIAIVQATRARRAAAAATLALRGAEKRLALDTLQAFPAILSDIGGELDWAESNDDGAVARFALLRLHSRSQDVLLLVSDESMELIERQKLVRCLKRVVRSSLNAKGTLPDSPSVTEALESLMKDLNELRGIVSAVTANIRLKVSGYASQ